MRNSFLSYVFRYGTAFCLFFLCILFERYAGLIALSQWFLFYILLRRTSFILVFSLSVFLDAAFGHALGSGPLLLSIQYLFIQLERVGRVGKILQWATAMATIFFVTALRLQSFNLPVRFWFVSLLFLFLIVFGVRVEGIWNWKKRGIYVA